MKSVVFFLLIYSWLMCAAGVGFNARAMMLRCGHTESQAEGTGWLAAFFWPAIIAGKVLDPNRECPPK